MKKYEVGKLYRLTFLDHCVGEQDVMTCEVAGWIIKETPAHLTLTYWQVLSEDEQVRRDNIEPVNIIKSTIKKSRKLA
jgi:hypothetical protein